jgi:hypothetical protein
LPLPALKLKKLVSLISSIAFDYSHHLELLAYALQDCMARINQDLKELHSCLGKKRKYLEALDLSQ